MTYIRLAVDRVPGAQKYGRRNNVPQRTGMREGGRGKEKEKGRVQKTDKGFMYNVHNSPEREAFGLDHRLGEKWGKGEMGMAFER